MDGIKKYIAPKEFYGRVLKIAVPIALQQLLNQAASFVDTLMVSKIGAIGAVALATQLDSFVGTVSFGINSGGQMYAAQFYGAKDYKSLKKMFGFQLLLNLLNGTIFFLIAFLCGRAVLNFYSSGNQELIEVGLRYLKISCFSYFAIAITNTYSFLYRSIHKTKVPMYVGILVMILNIILNQFVTIKIQRGE